MQKRLVLACAGFVSMLAINSCNSSSADQKPATEEKIAAAAAADPVKRGEYLVTIMGCNDCHSPKRMGPNGPELIPELMLSGYPSTLVTPPLAEGATKNGWVSLWADLTTAVGPWGQTYAANITSDSTGIGVWSEDQFKKALKEGKFKGMDGTRPIMPTMPWQNYKNIADEDVKAIFAYLKSTKPVKNVVPEAKLNPPPKA